MTVAVPVSFDPLRDSRHRDARAARDQADWLSWLELGGIRPRTLADYEWATARLLRMFPTKGIAEFTDGDIGHALRTFPPAGRRTKQAAYQSWFRWAKQTRRLTDNPMEYLPQQRRQPRKPVDVFTDTERAALEALPSPDGTLLALLFGTGIRKGEARNLRCRHIDLTRGMLRVLDGKGGKDRDVPLEAELVVALAGMFTLEGINADDYLWSTRPGGGTRIDRSHPIGEGSYHRWWVRALGRAGVRYMKPHTTRHTFATWWRRQGLDTGDVALLLGDTIAVTADYYDHTTMADVAARMAELRGEV